MTSLQSAFVLVPDGQPTTFIVPSLWRAAVPIFAVSFAVAIVVNRFGGRRALLYLGAGFLGLAGLSLFASAFYSRDILFVPLVCAATLSALVVQVKRLRERDVELTEKLIAASAKFESVHDDEAESRLLRGLQLLDTVLAPSEAIVFRRDRDGQLIFSARLRPQNQSLDTNRNSAWRDGISL